MNTVTFGTYNSYTDFGLMLTDVEIPAPVPKRNQVDVPGRDGVLDLSWYPLRYKNREIKLTFVIKSNVTDWLDYASTMRNCIHGLKLKTYFSTDSPWYWYGVVSVDTADIEIHKGIVEISIDAEPHKYKDVETKLTTTSSGTTITLTGNYRKVVYPTITTTAAITVGISGNTVSLSAGTHKNASIYFDEDTTEITFTGSSTVTMTYTEGSL